MREELDISILIGKILVNVDVTSDEVTFKTDKEEQYRLFHEQDCCENVRIEDVIGDVSDLLNTPILLAEEVDNSTEKAPEGEGSYTWTFYKLATVKGNVTLRFLGTSSGYYSENVTFQAL
jgi:hypothetical protein